MKYRITKSVHNSIFTCAYYLLWSDLINNNSLWKLFRPDLNLSNVSISMEINDSLQIFKDSIFREVLELTIVSKSWIEQANKNMAKKLNQWSTKTQSNILERFWRRILFDVDALFVWFHPRKRHYTFSKDPDSVYKKVFLFGVCSHVLGLVLFFCRRHVIYMEKGK